jgi:hypothetical protein
MMHARRLPHITPTPAVAKLPVERRDEATRRLLVRRIWGEFDELPGTSLTLGQAGRLFGIPTDVSARILAELVDCGMLRLGADGRYRRRSSAA